jgi:hypothetical protein
MKSFPKKYFSLLWLFWMGCAAPYSQLNAMGLETKTIEDITGLEGTFNEAEGVFKISAPRADVLVSGSMANATLYGLNFLGSIYGGNKN